MNNIFISFSAKALDDYNFWALTDKKTFKKLIKLISEISRTPYEGTGNPEQLKHELQ